jgi:3-oxoacyl-[acyl-carrier-protein] synthase-3
MQGIRFCSTGAAIPHTSVSNEALSQRVDTSDEWIRSRTGITARRIAAEPENLSQLAATAGRIALERAGWDPTSLDLILLATSSPDDLFGSAPRVQSLLGANRAVAFDLTAACSGFLFALITASQYLHTGAMGRALVIGADQLSRWVNWDDRSTCVLFGDGAGALAIEACGAAENGLLGFRMATDGRKADCLSLRQVATRMELIPGVSSQLGGFEPIAMNGQEVYKFAVREVPVVLQELLISTETSPSALDWLLLHQANQRILNAVAERLGLPSEKVLSNLAHYGNTSAATIPVMLHEAVMAGQIQPGHLIASSGFGAGLSWGAAIWRWAGPTP